MSTGVGLGPNTQYAGFWRRVAATIIDTIIWLPLLLMILYLIYGPAYFQWLMEDHSIYAVYGLADGLVSYLLPIIATVLLWVKFLGTPGKLLLDCHVVHADTGKPLSIGRALLRYVAYYISMLPLMLGLLWVGWDKRKQGFHDKIANSVVVIGKDSIETLEDL